MFLRSWARFGLRYLPRLPCTHPTIEFRASEGNEMTCTKQGKAMRSVLATAILGVMICSATSIQADDFYKGKSLTLHVGYAPGGGYDISARTFARHLPKHLAGSPNMVIKNMPGAGSIRLANHVFNVAAKDGLEIGAVGREIPTATLLRVANTQFKSDEFKWIGSLSSGKTFCIAWHEAPHVKADDMYEKQFIVGGSAGNSPTVIAPVILNNLIGTKIKVISGYRGGADMHLAMERGEVQGRCAVTISSLNASRPDWIRDKKVRFLLELSLAEKREFPDVPRIIEYAKTEAERTQLEILLAPEEWQRPLMAPPGVPDERVSLLRSAFDKVVTDPDYIADVDRQKLEKGPMSGAEMERRIKKLQALPAHLVDAALGAASKLDRTEIGKVPAPAAEGAK